LKKIILPIIISTTFVFGQTDNNAPSLFSTSENYKFELKKKGREGEITFSDWRSKQYPNRVVYTFSSKIKKKDIKSSTVEKDYDDKVVAKKGNTSGLWYDYSFDVYSYYKNGQLKEKGGVEHRYSDSINSNSVSGKITNTVFLGTGKQKGYVLKDGAWKGWYDNGELRYSTTHVNGKLHGQVNVYFKNGQKKSGGEYSYNRKVGKHAEWYKSGWIKEYSVDGVVKRSHKESEQAFFWNSKNDKNYQAAYALANESYSEISNPSKELELKSKSNPIPSERIYETFSFTSAYKRYADSWYIGDFYRGPIAISISSRYRASLLIDINIGWMRGSLSYDGRSSLGDEYVWRHENATNDEDDVTFYFNNREEAIYTGGGYRMSRGTSRSINVHEVEYIFNCKDGKCTKD
tara:strand:+ start:1068 stop:2279 length:1212 start_codon:yes stop_codon:yes gene_type:complete